MPISFTRRGRYRLTRDGVEISQHNVPEEAYENAFEDAESGGDATYRIYPPEYVEFRVPVTTIAQRTTTRPPPASGFTAPNAPSGVSAAQGTPTTSVIRVSFTPGTDTNTPAATITSNKLYGASSSGGTFTLVATLGAAATTGDETGIAPSTQRFYKVSTVNEHGLESVLSSEVNATTAAGSPAAGEPAIYALEVIYPQATGVAGTGRHANNRCYYAYPGILYSITACAIGGSYPYVWSISNAPVGMSINSSTGVISMASPSTGTYSNIQVTCTDALGTVDSETYSIVVGTSGWNFVDAVSGNDITGTGAIGAPWQTLSKLRASAASGSRTYIRAGTYLVNGLPIDSGSGTISQRTSLSQATICIAYPGDAQPVLDMECDGTDTDFGSFIELTGPALYFDGFKLYRGRNHFFRANVRSSGYGAQFRNCLFEQLGPGTNGVNSAMIMWTAGGDGSGADPSWHDIVVGCTFTNVIGGTGNCALKLYGMNKWLIHGNTFSNTGTHSEGTIAIKGGLSAPDGGSTSLVQGTVRANTLDCDVTAIGGNMAGNAPGYSGEICYNNVYSDDTALTLGVSKVTTLGVIDVYRNTFRGRILLQNLVTADGPYTLRHNVIVNADSSETPWPHIAEFAVSDQTRFVIDNNLVGVAADGIVDASGNLQGAYLTSYGPSTANPRGYQT